MEEASSSSSSVWTKDQEKAFENALATHPDDCSDRWEKIAADVPGKTIDDVKLHYELLVEDVNGIESGRVPLPRYASSSDGDDSMNGGGRGKKAGYGHGDSSKNLRSDQERRKGIAWSEEEHRLFLLGLEKYGKGDWRSISRNFVISRTPTQVASHAQKYFIRLNSMNKERRRTSIHDITTAAAADPSAPQIPITGQMNTLAAAVAREKTGKHPVGVSIFGTPIGQPAVGVQFPAVGTLVNLPVPAASHVGYAVRVPVSIPSSTYRVSSSASGSLLKNMLNSAFGHQNKLS